MTVVCCAAEAGAEEHAVLSNNVDAGRFRGMANRAPHLDVEHGADHDGHRGPVVAQERLAQHEVQVVAVLSARLRGDMLLRTLSVLP